MKCPVCDKKMHKSRYKITTELEIGDTIARSILTGYKCKPHSELPVGRIGGKYSADPLRLIAILYEPAMGFTVQYPNKPEISAFALASRRMRFTTGIEGSVTCLNKIHDLQILENNYGVLHYLEFNHVPRFDTRPPGIRKLWDLYMF